MTTTTPRPEELDTSSAHPDPGFKAAFGSEWAKLMSARSPRRNLMFGIGLGMVLSVLLAWVSGATFDDWNASEQADFDPVTYSLAGSILTAIFFAAVGVNAMTSEHTSGMIRLTYAVTPRRGRVVLAKAAAVGVATSIASAITMTAMVGFSQLIYGAYDLPTASLLDGDVLWLIAGIAILGPMFPVIAVAISSILRTTAASLSTVLAIIFLPSVLGGLLPRWWQENVVAALPGPASDAVVMNHITDSDLFLPTPIAATACAAWVVGLLALAIRTVERRDA